MIVAFTGTRGGMTHFQKVATTDLFDLLHLRNLHHGCCEGADRDAHQIALSVDAYINGWPSNWEQAEWARQHRVTTIHPTAPPLVRNHDIVDHGRVLVATPKKHVEEQRSGTWATIRYARKLKRPIYLVWPDGSVTAENDILPKARR